MILPETNIFILDSTVFIGLDFPKLLNSQIFQNALFFTTSSISLELKDFRSRMNLDILKESKNLQIINPHSEILEKLKIEISRLDPNTTLSMTDIEILALALQLKGIVISNDLTLQNAAVHLKIPFNIISGKKITQLRKWQLKCKSCGKLIDKNSQFCPYCSGRLKKISININKLKEKKEK